VALAGCGFTKRVCGGPSYKCEGHQRTMVLRASDWCREWFPHAKVGSSSSVGLQ
jgi:hypothetical protein